MEILNEIDSNLLLLGVGALMLLGSFATINSRSSSKFDQDIGLILMIAGAVCLALGFNIIDITDLKNLGNPEP